MIQTTKNEREKQKRNLSNNPSIPLVNSILFIKKYRNHILFVAQGRKTSRVKQEEYHILILKKEDVEKINHLKGFSNYLIITIKPSSEIYDKYKCLFESKIIDDSTKVAINALQNAASIERLTSTTETSVANLEEKKIKLRKHNS